MFLPATNKDANLIYHWRRQAETGSWYQDNHVNFPDHRTWLQQRLRNRLVEILIWQPADVPIGMIRIDSNNELTYWPHNDQALPMLQAAKQLNRKLKVTIDRDDPGAAILARAGYKEHPARFFSYKP